MSLKVLVAVMMKNQQINSGYSNNPDELDDMTEYYIRYDTEYGK